MASEIHLYRNNKSQIKPSTFIVIYFLLMKGLYEQQICNKYATKPIHAAAVSRKQALETHASSLSENCDGIYPETITGGVYLILARNPEQPN
jgi:hypothetical protein